MNNKNIFVSCGEVSGDIYAGDFIREILKLIPDLEIWGMMGINGEKSGGTVTWSYDELKLMGFIEIIPALPRIFKLKNEMTREILKKNPVFFHISTLSLNSRSEVFWLYLLLCLFSSLKFAFAFSAGFFTSCKWSVCPCLSNPFSAIHFSKSFSFLSFRLFALLPYLK